MVLSNLLRVLVDAEATHFRRRSTTAVLWNELIVDSTQNQEHSHLSLYSGGSSGWLVRYGRNLLLQTNVWSLQLAQKGIKALFLNPEL